MGQIVVEIIIPRLHCSFYFLFFLNFGTFYTLFLMMLYQESVASYFNANTYICIYLFLPDLTTWTTRCAARSGTVLRLRRQARRRHQLHRHRRLHRPRLPPPLLAPCRPPQPRRAPLPRQAPLSRPPHQYLTPRSTMRHQYRWGTWHDCLMIVKRDLNK